MKRGSRLRSLHTLSPWKQCMSPSRASGAHQRRSASELGGPDRSVLFHYTGVIGSLAAGLDSVPGPTFLEAGLACCGSKPRSSNHTVGPSGDHPILSHLFSTYNIYTPLTCTCGMIWSPVTMVMEFFHLCLDFYYYFCVTPSAALLLISQNLSLCPYTHPLTFPF